MNRIIALLTLALCLTVRAAIPPPSTYDWEAYRWAFVHIPSQSGTILAQDYRAGTQFMLDVKKWSVRPRLGRVNLYLGNETNAMVCPIIYDFIANGETNDVPVNFAATDYSRTNGLAGNTTSKSLQGAVGGWGLASFVVHTNIHLAAYVRTPTNEATAVCGFGSPGGTYQLLVSFSGFTYNRLGTTLGLNVADSNGQGFYLATRTATNSGIVYKNGAAIHTNSADEPGTIDGGFFLWHANNSAGVVGSWTSRAIGYIGVGLSIWPDQQAAYNIAVRKVQESVPRAVP